MTKTVALKKCDTYDFDLVFQAVKNLFELCPPPDFRGKTVLLKPNILYGKNPDKAVSTHPVVVAAAVKAFVEGGAKTVLVGESPAVGNSTGAAKSAGIYRAVEDNGGVWADFSEKITVQVPEGKLIKSVDFAKQFQEADLVVSVSKLKTHQLMAYTGAMKNLFGLMIGLEKAQCHYRFPEKKDFAAFLTDLNLAAKSGYAIMDAIVGMEGKGGPGTGDPKKLGFLASSDNILALDWECSKLVGYNPHSVANLEDALQRGVWLKDENEISVAGEKEDDVRCADFKIVKEPSERLGKMLPKWVDALAKKIFTRTPKFQSKKCIRCQKCLQICPAHLITMEGKNGSAILKQKDKCLHCFCCHEICPASAIKLKH